MPRSSLSETEQVELKRLVGKVIDDGRFVPDSCYQILYSLCPRVIVEVLLYDPIDGRFVLKHRKDEHFVGWHVPGGELKVDKVRQAAETIQAACDRHIRLDGVAKGVQNLRLIGVHPYEKLEHPFGFPVINLVACEAVDPVIERPDCKWFSETPPDILPHPVRHDRYLEVFREWFASDRKGYAKIF